MERKPTKRTMKRMLVVFLVLIILLSVSSLLSAQEMNVGGISSADSVIKRTATTNTHDNGDGTFTTTFYSFPVNVLKEGAYVPFDEVVKLERLDSHTLRLTGPDSITDITFGGKIGGETVAITQDRSKFDIIIEDQKTAYKFNYDLGLPNENFEALVTINSDKDIHFEDQDVIVDGLRISFKDVLDYDYDFDYDMLSGNEVVFSIFKDYEGQGIKRGDRIFIDPVIMEYTNNSGSYDTYIRESSPSTNYGTATTIYIERPDERAILLFFNISTIPAGSAINNSILSLYHSTGTTLNRDIQVTAYMINESWNETEATYNNMFNKYLRDFSSNSVLVDYHTGRLYWNVTSIVQGWVDGADIYGFYLNATKEDSSDQAKGFRSGEYASPSARPFLNITYSASGGGSNPANESESRTAIEAGISQSTISGSATTYTDQQLYLTYLNTSQMLGSFDKMASSGSQRWAFNYITGSDSYIYMLNMTPSVYVLELFNMTSNDITTAVKNLIDNTQIG